MFKYVVIVLHQPYFNLSDGGNVVQHYLAKLLDEEYGINVKMITSDYGKIIYPLTIQHTQNEIFNKYWKNDFPINDDVIVIYCEGIWGNPLKAKYVVRWMLSELGKNMPSHVLNTWSKNELVYYFNNEAKFNKNPEKLGNIIKKMNPMYINPNFKNLNLFRKNEWCFTMRKYHYHKEINILHPQNSFEITKNHKQYDYFQIFNNFKYFISYDPLTFLTVISALCGCVSIVYKTEGLTEYEWLNTLSVTDYIKYKGINKLYGIAYGIENIEYAMSTLNLVQEQWIDIINFNNQSVKLFVDDIKNLDNMVNTIENNYFTT